ncbi:MAG: YdcF family protein [Flavobacteriales bacterium]|nr:YdcF family protein [Flavobacteriales bacterium]
MSKSVKGFIYGNLLLFFLLAISGFLFRKSIFDWLGRFLQHESAWEGRHYNFGFILGGQPQERGLFAAQLYHQGVISHLVCVGGNYPRILRLTGDTCSEGRLTAVQLLQAGVPDSCITVIPEGTSTQGECQAFVNFIRQREGSILVITSRIHTRRTLWTLRRLLRDLGRPFDIVGAPSFSYDEAQWWKSEEGLIGVNNEYLKLLYYLYKYGL